MSIPIIFSAGRDKDANYRDRERDLLPGAHHIGHELKGRDFLPHLIPKAQAAGFGPVYVVGEAALNNLVLDFEDAYHVVTPQYSPLGRNMVAGLEQVIASGLAPGKSAAIMLCDINPSVEELKAVLEAYEQLETAAMTFTTVNRDVIDPRFKKRSYTFKMPDGTESKYSNGHIIFTRPHSIRLNAAAAFANLIYAFRGDATTSFLEADMYRLDEKRRFDRVRQFASLMGEFFSADEQASFVPNLATRGVLAYAAFILTKKIDVPFTERAFEKVFLRNEAQARGEHVRWLFTDLAGLAIDADDDVTEDLLLNGH